MTVKMRKVGNSRVLTIPKNVHLKNNTYYDVFKGRNGALVYLHHRQNPFKNPQYVREHLGHNDHQGFIDMEDGREK